MPDRKLFKLCREITNEREPQKLTQLIDELSKLLKDEQENIKAKIRANIGRGTTEGY